MKAPYWHLGRMFTPKTEKTGFSEKSSLESVSMTGGLGALSLVRGMANILATPFISLNLRGGRQYILKVMPVGLKIC